MQPVYYWQEKTIDSIYKEEEEGKGQPTVGLKGEPPKKELFYFVQKNSINILLLQEWITLLLLLIRRARLIGFFCCFLNTF